MTIKKRCRNDELESGSRMPETLQQSYGFSDYVTKERMLTLWYQLTEVLRLKPSEVLEIGIGPRVVAGVLRESGMALTTADINPALRPDHVVAVQELDSKFEDDSFDLVLCARVLHHVSYDEFDHCLGQLRKVTKRHVILTLPVDDLRAYASFRVTATRSRTISVAFPRLMKRALLSLFPAYRHSEYRRLWKVNSSAETSLERVRSAISAHFEIERDYTIAEDQSHCVFVLKKRRS